MSLIVSFPSSIWEFFLINSAKGLVHEFDFIWCVILFILVLCLQYNFEIEYLHLKKNLSLPCCFQEPLILERKGIKIGFLGYCDTPSPTIKKNCTEMRMLFNSGPAIYGDDIAKRDVQHLKKVFF